jgi:hypothetical protein
VSDQLLTVLQLCLLVLVYLFFLRVLRSVWVEVRGADSSRREPRKRTAASPPATLSRLAVVAPADTAGSAFDLGDELTVGRAAGCHVTLDDTYASQLHARVFRREGQLLVEDLGSTNGTYLNRQRVSSPVPFRKGDQLQVGNTVMELT